MGMHGFCKLTILHNNFRKFKVEQKRNIEVDSNLPPNSSITTSRNPTDSRLNYRWANGMEQNIQDNIY